MGPWEQMLQINWFINSFNYMVIGQSEEFFTPFQDYAWGRIPKQYGWETNSFNQF